MRAVLAGTGVITLVVALACFVGFVFEFEYPHFFEIRRVRHAVTPDGRPALAMLATALGTEEDRLHVHICSYCRDRLSGVPETTYVQVSQRDVEAPILYAFAYHRGTNELVPADDEALDKFRSLVPAHVRLAPGTDPGSHPDLRVPEAWLPSR